MTQQPFFYITHVLKRFSRFLVNEIIETHVFRTLPERKKGSYNKVNCQEHYQNRRDYYRYSPFFPLKLFKAFKFRERFSLNS